ncbi:hypothetical protein [Suilimivivens sp.]|uniref:hypothetical protein n=1 Tax=Suilimivivens sp. TaxID=2981669 RepID=UPI00307C0C58
MKESKSKDTYYLDGTYTYPNAVIDVYRPVISEEERARRMKRLERVVAEIMIQAMRDKEMKGGQSNG